MAFANIQEKSPILKLAIVFISMAVTYILSAHVVTPLFLHSENSPFHNLFPQDEVALGNSIFIVSIFISIAIGLIIIYYLKINFNFVKKVQTETEQKPSAERSEANLQILKKMMTEDEKKLVEEIEKAGEITQDSLRLRLDWSKAKVSTVLSILDRQGVVQKERSGKTYRVHLEPDLQKRKIV